MIIDPQVSSKINLIKQLNEDLARLSMTADVPESDDVKLSFLSAIEDAAEDTGSDSDVVPNTKITVQYTVGEEEKTITFKYRRLSLAIIAAKREFSEENKSLETYQYNTATLETDNNYADTLFAAFAEKAKIPVDANVLMTRKSEDPLKGENVYVFTGDSRGDLTVVPESTLAAKVKVREDSVGLMRAGSTNNDMFYKTDAPVEPTFDVTDLYLPVSLTEVPANVFNGKTRLSDTIIHFHDGVTTIADEAFKDSVNNLSSIDFNNVTSVGARAFSGATTTLFALPDTVTTFGENAFGDVTTFAYSGDISRAYAVAKKQPGGASASYVNSTAADADEEERATISISLDNNSVMHFVESELSSQWVEEHAEFKNDIGSITYHKAVGESATVLNGVTIATLAITNATTVPAEAFKDSVITDLYIGDQTTFADDSFKNTDITNVRVSSAERAEEVRKLPAFQTANLGNDDLSPPVFKLYYDDTVIKPVEEPEAPQGTEVASAGFNYDATE